jgi:hypothetical protein
VVETNLEVAILTTADNFVGNPEAAKLTIIVNFVGIPEVAC